MSRLSSAVEVLHMMCPRGHKSEFYMRPIPYAGTSDAYKNRINNLLNLSDKELFI